MTNGRTVRANVIFIRSLARNFPVIFASHRAVWIQESVNCPDEFIVLYVIYRVAVTGIQFVMTSSVEGERRMSLKFERIRPEIHPIALWILTFVISISFNFLAASIEQNWPSQSEGFRNGID